jgi:NitT/TauT family transport system permease protein
MNKQTLKNIRAQLIFIIAVIVVWQVMSGSGMVNQLTFPSITEIGRAFVKGFAEDGMMGYVLYSLSLLLRGLIIGIALAFLFSSLCMISKTVYSIYNMVTSICDLIPGVALIPIAMGWFGIGEAVIIFIVVHGVIWPMSRSILGGFSGINRMYVEEGRIFGLKGARLITGVYLPATLGTLISGIRMGWARAWRGLIAIEMIFGTTGSGAGIGWYIFMKRTNMNYAGMFAALIVIILIGMIVEYLVFQVIEKKTVVKWGMA